MIISRTTHSAFTDIRRYKDSLRGTTYGATDGPERPSMEAIFGPGDYLWH